MCLFQIASSISFESSMFVYFVWYETILQQPTQFNMKFLRATNNKVEAAAKRFIVIVLSPSAIVFALFNYKPLIQRSIDDPLPFYRPKS